MTPSPGRFRRRRSRPSFGSADQSDADDSQEVDDRHQRNERSFSERHRRPSRVTRRAPARRLPPPSPSWHRPTAAREGPRTRGRAAQAETGQPSQRHEEPASTSAAAARRSTPSPAAMAAERREPLRRSPRRSSSGTSRIDPRAKSQRAPGSAGTRPRTAVATATENPAEPHGRAQARRVRARPIARRQRIDVWGPSGRIIARGAGALSARIPHAQARASPPRLHQRASDRGSPTELLPERRPRPLPEAEGAAHPRARAQGPGSRHPHRLPAPLQSRTPSWRSGPGTSGVAGSASRMPRPCSRPPCAARLRRTSRCRPGPGNERRRVAALAPSSRRWQTCPPASSTSSRSPGTGQREPSWCASKTAVALVEPTVVRLGWTPALLLVRFDCVDLEPWATLAGRDEPLWQEEVVELFLAAGEADPATYVELEVNPLGALFDGLIANPGLERARSRRTWRSTGRRSAGRPKRSASRVAGGPHSLCPGTACRARSFRPARASACGPTSSASTDRTTRHPSTAPGRRRGSFRPTSIDLAASAP